ncbi:MAG TPA: hypothetical protein VFV50_09870, partial [Bdellovibrionales bacterium]|nr:hypothetical protein [Bdellovibrionales bacterium]
ATSSAGLSEKMRITSGGNVGIGTATPGSRLEVSNDSTSNGLALKAGTSLQQATGDEVAYQLNYTTNKATSGNDTGLEINMTDTSSPGTSYGINYKRNGSSVFSVRNDGSVIALEMSAGQGIRSEDSVNTYRQAVRAGNVNPGAAASNAILSYGDRGYLNGGTEMMTFSSGFTPAGAYQPDSGVIRTQSLMSNGLSLTTLHASAPIKFYTGGSADANERMKIDASGNVGIGTSSPNQKLHITGGSARVDNTGSPASVIVNRTDGKVAALVGANSSSAIRFDNSGDFAIQSQPEADLRAGNGSNLTDRLVVLANGRVGIGTSVPSSQLSLGGQSAQTLGVERHLTAETVGSDLTISAGGAASGATNKAGGTLNLRSGLATGNGGSTLNLQVAGWTGTATDDAPYTTLLTLQKDSKSALGSNHVFGTAAYSTAVGVANKAAGYSSLALGREVNVTGSQSIALGAGSTSLAAGHVNNPTVSGNNSIGVFLGDQTGAVVSSNSVMAILGGNVGIGAASPDDKLHVVGQIRIDNDTNTTNKGCIRFDGATNKLQFANDCATWADIGSGTGTVGPTLTGITDVENAGGGINLTPSAGNAVVINRNTASTQPTNGALVVNGGAGVQGALNVGGAIVANDNMSVASSQTADNTNNYNSPSIQLTAKYWDGAASQVDRWSITNAMGTGANPTSTLSFAHPAGTTGAKYYSFQDGSVGIGTATPGALLQIRNSSSNTDMQLTGNILSFNRSSGQASYIDKVDG